MAYQHIKVPTEGTPITANEDHSLNVPNTPIIPYIEGDGIGIDISPVMIKVVDAAVEKAYAKEKKIAWMEIYTGEKAAELYEGDWFPQETLDAIKSYLVAIKGLSDYTGWWWLQIAQRGLATRARSIHMLATCSLV